MMESRTDSRNWRFGTSPKYMLASKLQDRKQRRAVLKKRKALFENKKFCLSLRSHLESSIAATSA